MSGGGTAAYLTTAINVQRIRASTTTAAAAAALSLGRTLRRLSRQIYDVTGRRRFSEET